MNKQTAALLSVFSNTILIIFKLIAGLAMNSISVISEAIHSLIDLVASVIAFVFIRIAAKPIDNGHPFGHGKYENISGFVEAILILIAGIIIIYESIMKLIFSSKVENLDLGLVVMIISAVINLVISLNLLRISKKTKSLALEADGMHLLTDTVTSFGVFLGLVLVKITGMVIFDRITAIIMALLIIKTSIGLINKSMKDLVDSSLSSEDIEKIINTISKHNEIKAYHKLRTRACGETKEIDIHLQLEGDTTLLKAHIICDNIENEIKLLFPKSHVLIHAEPLN
jgi:cation diffusion facilitator family transporter